MTAKQTLESLLDKSYLSEGDETFCIELKSPLSQEEMLTLTQSLPANHLPSEINELLSFTRGFDFAPLEEITFDSFGYFGLNEFFPFSVQLCSDGFGNFWILDITQKGKWGNVYFVCHDPPVIVKQAESLSQFLLQVDEFGRYSGNSVLNQVHEKIVFEIWDNTAFIPVEDALNSNDAILKNFASNLPKNFYIADLRNTPIKSGFAWGKFGHNIDNAKRHKTELLWAIEKPKKKGFLSKLFG